MTNSSGSGRGLVRIGEIEDADHCIEAFQRAGAEGRTALILGKRIEGLDSVLMGRLDNLLMVEVLK